MPWNYPFWQALRFAVPGLIAGNASLLKHASNVTGCAFAIEEAFREAGFPEDVFRTIVPDYDTIDALIASDLVQGVSLTGSNAAGMTVGGQAGRHVKKCVLELGGSDPFIVLEDADIEFTARGAVAGRMVGGGRTVRERVNAYALEVSGFCASIRTGVPLRCGVELAQGAARACLAAHEAIEKKARVAVPALI
jgi:acyl-CoA reductase-like NAD-dependent aldehyde dehydrogenase